MVLACTFAISAAAPIAEALVFASPDTEPQDEIPPDFPYWENITQRRYEGPTVIYLGGGYAMTARHVGMGEIELGGVMYKPIRVSRRSLLNINGTPADAIVFALDPSTGTPDLPVIPIAEDPVQPGEDILLIGFGRGREKVIEYELDGKTRFGFTWSKKGTKRWGTNRVESNYEILTQSDYTTRAVTFRFDEPFSPGATRYEAHAAVGDSGGAVFVERDGVWQLAALMISVSGDARVPGSATIYGDATFAADLSYYRDEILRWTRPLCSNELDDDGDERIDFPADPGCESPTDRNEWDTSPMKGREFPFYLSVALGAAGALFLVGRQVRRAQRGTSTPDSTSISSVD